MNISLLLEMICDAAPDRIAVTGADCRLTYRQLHDGARALALSLAQEPPGAIVYLAENHPAAAIVLFGAALGGRAYVPINYRLNGHEIEALLHRAAPVLVVTDREVTGYATLSPADLAAQGALPTDVVLADVSADSVAVELFTSGTTGAPKAALLRHAHLMSYILGTVEFLGADEQDSALVCVPPYHIAGISALLSSVYAGRRIVLLPAFTPETWLGLAAQERVTSAFLVPTMLQRIVAHVADHPQAAQVPSLQAVAYGGGRMPRETIAAAMVLWPQVNFTNAYGLTETSSTICLLTPEDHRAAAALADDPERCRLGAVGKPVPGIELVILDDAGQPAGPGVVGLVHVRGGQVAGEYREGGQRLGDEGWFCTRDLGWLDAEGYLFLDGRADDVIVRGAENISPGEIVDVLRAHPDVADAAVFGVPDSEWGEAVAAAIVPTDGRQVSAGTLQELVRAALRSSRVPQHVRFVEALPYNEMGKLLRRALRDAFAAECTSTDGVGN